MIQKGHDVTIFEARPAPGGLLVYGIPNFKLSKSVWFEKWEEFERAGVKFVPNTYIGKDITIDGLFEKGFEAVFLGVGSEVDAKMEDTPGTDLPGVYQATDFLIRGNVARNLLPADMKEPLKIGKRVVVIGGGDTASDCLRTALRMGAAEVTCLYRRTEKEMPGGKKDRKMAREEGAKYRFLTQPVKFIAGEDGHLAAVECIEMVLGEPDSQGPPQTGAGAEFELQRCMRYGNPGAGLLAGSDHQQDHARSRDTRLGSDHGHEQRDRRDFPPRCVLRRRLRNRPGHCRDGHDRRAQGGTGDRRVFEEQEVRRCGR